MHLPTKPDTTPKSIYNPSKEDFTTTFANEENVPIPYTAPSQEISTFPTYIANHIAKHLCHKLIMERGIKKNYQDDYDLMMKQIETGL